jgi:hypothetical protein
VTASGVDFGTNVHGYDRIDISANLKYLGNQPLPAGITWTEIKCSAGLFGANPVLYSDAVTPVTNAPFAKCGTADGYDFYYLDGVQKEVGFSRDMILSGNVAVDYAGAANCYVQAVTTTAKRC